LAALAPDVIMTIGGTATGFLLQATRTVPIVFTIVPDPVSSGFINSLSRPGGNATGFLQFEYSFCVKWVELLREIGPVVVQAAVLRDAILPSGVGQFAVIQYVAPPLGIEVSPVNVRDAAEIERDVSAFARATKSGLIVASSTRALVSIFGAGPARGDEVQNVRAAGSNCTISRSSICKTTRFPGAKLCCDGAIPNVA
jgi:putative ABC transport system substrate-binding protein